MSLFVGQVQSNNNSAQLSFLDTKLNEVRFNKANFPSADLVLYADYNFNLRNEPRFFLKLTDEVRWQIYFAAASKNVNGNIDTGAFSIAHLQTNDLVVLYRILNSYHRVYEKERLGDNAIFSKHLQLIEARFTSNEQMALDVIRTLEAQYDPLLKDVTGLVKGYTDQLQAARLPPKPVLSFLDTKLEEVRKDWTSHPSGGLIIWADIHFNLGNQPNKPLLSEEVKWQILFASASKKNANGLIDFGSFSVAHLKIADLVVLYRILRSYHFSYEKQRVGQEAIFSKHLEIIETKFKSNVAITQEAIRLLEAQGDLNLEVTINALKDHVAPPQGGFINGYCKTRIGVENPSFRNCPYNSLAVVYAHTGLADKALSAPLSKVDEQRQAIIKAGEEDIRTRSLDIQERERELSGLVAQKMQLEQEMAQLSEFSDRANKKYENLREKTTAAYKKNQAFEALDTPIKPSKKKDELADYKEKLRALRDTDEDAFYLELDNIGKDLEHIQCFTSPLIDRNMRYSPCKDCLDVSKQRHNYFDRIDKLRDKIQSFTDQIQDKQPYLEFLKGRIDPLVKSGQERIKEFDASMNELEENRLDALKTLQILRGEKRGQLTEASSKNLCATAATLGVQETGHLLYNHSPQTVALDAPHYLELKRALENPNLRVIRIGGFGHWWNYVKNPDGKTFDTINDTIITRNSMTIDQLFMTYSNPEAWKQTQLTFFSLPE